MPSLLRLGFVLLVYNLLLPVLLIVSLPGYILKMMRRGGYGGRFPQRFGVYSEKLEAELECGRRPMWVHAVSVGEVLIAAKMIEELWRQDPGHRVVLSTTTSTGYAVAEERLGGRATILFSPLDFPWVAVSVLGKIDPEQIVLIEAEVWPNLLCAARLRGIPVRLVNARLSARSERRMTKFGFFIRPLYGLLDRVLVQSGEDVKRLENIGAGAERIVLTGSIKYDPQGVERPPLVDGLDSELRRIFGNEARPVLLAGSTHEGEEELIGRAYLEIQRRVPDLFYIVVPRHFERTDRIVARMRRAGLKPLLRTAMEEAPDGCCGKGAAYDSLIVNTTGELSAWYYLAAMAVIGKSFLSKGGQNPVEAVTAGVPVLSGREMSNFTSLVLELEKAGGMVRVNDGRELAEVAVELLLDAERARKQTAAARQVLNGHEGATRRTVRLLLGEG